MNLNSTIDLMAIGGPGSGPNVPCPQCGPHGGEAEKPVIKKKSYLEKEAEGLEKYKQGLASEKKVLGIWNYSSGKAVIYKTLMAGDWHKVEELKPLLKEGADLQGRLDGIRKAGKRSDLFTLEYKNGNTEVRLVMKQFGNAAKGQVEITGDQQHAALTAVSKLMSVKGLDTQISKQVMDQFMKDAGLTSLAKVSSAVHSWTGSSQSEGGTWLRKVASEYYGRPWSSEYSGKDHGAASIKDKTLDPELRTQALAVKALATAYAQADGTKYLYRGIDLTPSQLEAVKAAKEQGLETVKIPMNALSSWSTRQDIGFGAIKLRREVDPDDVWFANKAMSHLFTSHQHEQEWILGTKEPFLTLKTSDVWLTNEESKAPWEPKPKAIDPKTGVDYLEKQISSQKGTNPGGTYKGSDGVERYIKFYNDPNQGHGEALANKIYNDLGIGAPKSTIINTGTQEAHASEIISGGKTLQQSGASSDDAKKVLKGFAADVLTGNWDAVGTGLDNILVKGDNVYRIDNGSAFLYRAQGSMKPSGVLDQISEWDKFLDPSTNKHYSGLAAKAGITKADQIPDIKQQVDKIVALRDKNDGWSNYIDKVAPYVKYKETIAKMLEQRTKLLQKKVSDLKAYGMPGRSGRKKTKLDETEIRRASPQERSDPRQRSLYGPGHTKELIKYYKKQGLKGAEELVDSELGPISRKLGTKIVKEGTQFCVKTENDSLGCYPDREAAMRVAKGGSFIDFKAGYGMPSRGAVIGHKKKVHKAKTLGLKPVGHHLPGPSMPGGKGVGHRFPNPTFEAKRVKSYADGEPTAGAYQHAHIEPMQWFSPPSLKKRGKQNSIPTDDPGVKDNRFLDVTKRNSKDTNEQRMKLLKRQAPGGLPPQIPAHTTLVAPHTASYLPGMFSSAMRRKRRNGGSFKAFGAARI